MYDDLVGSYYFLFVRGKIASFARKVDTVRKIALRNPLGGIKMLKYVWNVVIQGMKCSHARVHILQMTSRSVMFHILCIYKYVYIFSWHCCFYQEIQCYVCKCFGHLCCVNNRNAGPREVSCYRCGQLGHNGWVSPWE